MSYIFCGQPRAITISITSVTGSSPVLVERYGAMTRPRPMLKLLKLLKLLSSELAGVGVGSWPASARSNAR